MGSVEVAYGVLYKVSLLCCLRRTVFPNFYEKIQEICSYILS